MKKSESVLENKAHEIIKDFETKMDHPISVRRSELESIN